MPEALAKPTLSLGLKTVPLKLQAFKAKIGVKAVMEVREPQPAVAIVPQSVHVAHVQKPRQLDNTDVVSDAAGRGLDHTGPPDSASGSLPARAVDPASAQVHLANPPAKKPRRRRPASILAIDRADLFPAISIAGTPVPVENTKVYPDPKAAERAARHWCRRIALEVAALVPEGQSFAAERFTMRHRLSITNSFFRRLRRADVTAAILELFRS
jgi:hypothetical protein